MLERSLFVVFIMLAVFLFMFNRLYLRKRLAISKFEKKYGREIFKSRLIDDMKGNVCVESTSVYSSSRLALISYLNVVSYKYEIFVAIVNDNNGYSVSAYGKEMAPKLGYEDKMCDYLSSSPIKFGKFIRIEDDEILIVIPINRLGEIEGIKEKIDFI